MPTTSGKDTIYIDIDDEITSVIEKVRSSNEKIVALVLPKRASVLQSIVNMKLLKRSADGAKKHVVLITSEAGLMPLAATVGFHVAKNLQSKPEVPSLLNRADDDDVIDDEPLEGPDAEPEITAETAGNKPVGELAAAAGTKAVADDSMETLSMDDDGEAEIVDADEPAAAKPPKKNKKLAIPNFDSFRLKLVLGAVLLVVLGAVLYVCTAILPKATITVTTDTSDVNSSLTLNLDTATKVLDASKLNVPATAQTVQKSSSQQVSTTGKKNNGTKAAGSVTMTAGSCSADVPNNVASGTGISSNGLTFITQESVSFSPVIKNSKCIFQGIGGTSGTTSIAMTSQTGGTNYNVSGASFTVAGRSDITASGSASGGTDNIVQVVAQADIDSASQKIASQNGQAVKSQLQTELKQAGLLAIASTFATGEPATTASSKVGDETGSVTVTQVISYTMFGVKQADLKTLVDADVQKHIDPTKQSILSEGIDKANFHVNDSTATTATIAMTTTATAGPDLKVDTIKAQVAGKKTGDIKSSLRTDPGVTDVQVKLSPFWVSKVPSKPAKITVTFEKASS